MSAFQGYGATKTQVAELFTILSIMRPHLSDTEEKFIETFIRPLKPFEDDCGNLILKVGKSPNVMWSSHVDTVHQYGGIAPLKLGDDGLIKPHPKSKANCLGADDGAGVWLMLQMARAKKPGLYVFHRGEERGCIGSRWLAKNTPKMLNGIEAAIAFDRKDVGSIITHQFGGRCCSEDFSKSLSGAIGLGMKSDSTGTVTDTAQYTDLVGECTNVSVGYKFQHSKSEEQDLPFLLALMDRMLDFDATKLTFKRKAGEKEKSPMGGYYGNYHDDNDDYSDGAPYGSSNRNSYRGSEYWKNPKLEFQQGKIWNQAEGGYLWPPSSGKVWDETQKKWVMKEPAKGARTYMDTSNRWRVARYLKSGEEVPETYLNLVKDYPEEIALILEEKAYGMGYLHDRIRAHGGVVTTRYLAKDTMVCTSCQRLTKFCQCDDPSKKEETNKGS